MDSTTPPGPQVAQSNTGLAYSFLATTPIDEVIAGNPRRVVPLLGFEWGFDIRAATAPAIELRAVAPIASDAWAAQLPVLRTAFPSPVWTFAERFGDDFGGS